MREAFRLLVCWALLIGVALVQASQTPTEIADETGRKHNVAQELDLLRKGNLAEADVGLLARAGVVQAIPDLKKQFGLTQELVPKLQVASALVKLGDKDSTWWDYLVQEASDAIASDAPSPQRFDSKGKPIPGLSPDLLAWAKVHHVTDSELETLMAELPAKVLFLGETGDRRAIPLLQSALSSPNFMVQAFAAKGLAKLKDKASIPLIIEACQQAPADLAWVIAGFLVDFDDPDAQNAVKVYRPAKDVK